MIVQELLSMLQELPPEMTILVDSTFASQGKPQSLRRVHLAAGSVFLCDHFLVAGPAFEFTSWDGQIYFVSYDNQVH